MYFKIDPVFLEHFKELKQVFLYITDECNLSCVQCLYKPNLTFHLKNKEIELDTALNLISDFKELGASKLTIIGGEPTLYGLSEGSEPLFHVIRDAKQLGYEYVRIDTNGMFSDQMLDDPDFKKLDEITFSLDGYNSELNDPVRGLGTFEKIISNMKKAVVNDYNVNITCCLHKELLKTDGDGTSRLDSMIEFASSLGISRINFHDLFKTGIPRDTWTGNIQSSIVDWASVFEDVTKKIEAEQYTIPVRIPQCFITAKEFDSNPGYYGYCPVKMGERVLVHPNGIIRICSLLICSPFGVARFYENTIEWDRSTTNELGDHTVDCNTPCTNQSKIAYPEDLVPLCVSFKPKQDEIIWNKEIQWENLRK